ncbi:MAG: LPP20 family lipoprotein [Bacteroidales bacterium]|nr:LPP20 family lipoprotein [Candidatus Latescibacterota bacterium]
MDHRTTTINWLRMQSTRCISAQLTAMIVLSTLIVSVVPARTQTARPAWVEDPTLEYPPSEYLVGVGSGESEEIAIENARANLAAGFRAHIRSQMQVEDEVTETFTPKSNTFNRATRTKRSIVVETSENLANVTLGGQWFEETSGRHHALVFIKRDEAEQTIGADIYSRLAQISELLDCNGRYPAVLTEYAGAAKAVALYREYEALSAQLRVVSEGRLGEIDAGLGSQVANWFSKTGNSLTLTIVAAPQNLTSSLRNALLNAGFTVVIEHALFTAELIYVTSPTPYSIPFVFEDWEMSLRIRHTNDGSEVFTLNWFNRAGHKSRKAAQERCLREARKILNDSLSVELEAFLADQ